MGEGRGNAENDGPCVKVCANERNQEEQGGSALFVFTSLVSSCRRPLAGHEKGLPSGRKRRRR